MYCEYSELINPLTTDTLSDQLSSFWRYWLASTDMGPNTLNLTAS